MNRYKDFFTMAQTQTVKLKDIADRAGVSVAAVSAALNGTGTVSAAMRERVRKVAQEMNYEPNFAAKLLKQKQNNDLGLIVSDIPERIFGSGYFMPMISCFIRQCEELGLRCQIEYYDLTKAEKLPALLTNGLAGGVLHGGVISPALREWLKKNPEFPFVAFEEEAEYNIMSDYSLSFYKAVQYLVALGHRRFGLAGGPLQYRRQQQIEDGFLRAVREFGLESRPEWNARFALASDADTLSEAVEWGRALFRRPGRPSALVCTDGRAARGILYAACETGIRVPEELSLLACSSQTEAEQSFPAVSSIAWNAPEALFKGVYLLRSLMEHRPLLEHTIEIEPVMTLRKTTGKHSA